MHAVKPQRSPGTLFGEAVPSLYVLLTAQDPGARQRPSAHQPRCGPRFPRVTHKRRPLRATSRVETWHSRVRALGSREGGGKHGCAGYVGHPFVKSTRCLRSQQQQALGGQENETGAHGATHTYNMKLF
jgi:hypothetical protein